jgi:threonine dehydrogenase-like Zn-dependent dehydrogenase
VAVLEPHDERRERAHALGAHAVHAAPAEVPGDADLTLDAVGAQATRHLALELLAPGARAVYIGLATDDTTLGFHHVVRGQLTLQGSYAYTMADFEQALEWLSDERVSVGELAAVRPLSDGPEAFARLAAGPPPAEVKVFLAGAGREA